MHETPLTCFPTPRIPARTNVLPPLQVQSTEKIAQYQDSRPRPSPKTPAQDPRPKDPTQYFSPKTSHPRPLPEKWLPPRQWMMEENVTKRQRRTRIVLSTKNILAIRIGDDTAKHHNQPLERPIGRQSTKVMCCGSNFAPSELKRHNNAHHGGVVLESVQSSADIQRDNSIAAGRDGSLAHNEELEEIIDERHPEFIRKETEAAVRRTYEQIAKDEASFVSSGEHINRLGYELPLWKADLDRRREAKILKGAEWLKMLQVLSTCS